MLVVERREIMTVGQATTVSDGLHVPDPFTRYLQAWNERDVAAIMTTLAPGGTYADPSTEGPLAGPALEQYLAGFFAAFPDVSFEVTAVYGSDDRLAVNWLMRGTNTGP